MIELQELRSNGAIRVSNEGHCSGFRQMYENTYSMNTYDRKREKRHDSR